MEFLTMMGEHLFEFDGETELIEAFESFDESDTGFVKAEEMRRWLSEVGERMQPDEVRLAPRTFDGVVVPDRYLRARHARSIDSSKGRSRTDRATLTIGNG
jgi:hypothetical protein